MAVPSSAGMWTVSDMPVNSIDLCFDFILTPGVDFAKGICQLSPGRLVCGEGEDDEDPCRD
jgi:hypothetical protein